MILLKNGKKYGVECKRTDAPRLTPSLRGAVDELKLKHLAVIYPGSSRYQLARSTSAVPVESLTGGIKGLFTP